MRNNSDPVIIFVFVYLFLKDDRCNVAKIGIFSYVPGLSTVI